jgi:flagellar motor switch/type III secretory pathway protein FliN
MPWPDGDETVPLGSPESFAAALLEAAGQAPVQVRAVVGRATVPRERSPSALLPGQLLTLSEGVHGAVELWADDVFLAMGELVRFEGRLAVRILAGSRREWGA